MTSNSKVDDYIVRLVRDGSEQLAQIRELKAHIAEFVESEEKAWQTVAKLRVELGTTDRLRMEIINLKLELAEEKRLVEVLGKDRDYNFDERCRLEALLVAHGASPGPDIRIGMGEIEEGS